MDNGFWRTTTFLCGLACSDMRTVCAYGTAMCWVLYADAYGVCAHGCAMRRAVCAYSCAMRRAVCAYGFAIGCAVCAYGFAMIHFFANTILSWVGVMLYIIMECVVFQSHFYARFYQIGTKLEFQFKISIYYMICVLLQSWYDCVNLANVTTWFWLWVLSSKELVENTASDWYSLNSMDTAH